MFLDNDKIFLITHYGLQNRLLVKSNTVLKWTEAVQAKTVKLSYTFCWFSIICGQDLCSWPQFCTEKDTFFFWNILNCPAEQITLMKNVLLKHNSSFCMVYTIIFIDYKLKRAFNVKQILGGLFYILNHQNPRDVLAALAVFQNHLQCCLYKITRTFCPPWQELETSLHSPQSKFSAPVWQEMQYSLKHSMGLENQCWADLDMAAKWTGSRMCQSSLEASIKVHKSNLKYRKEEEKRKLSGACRRYNWPLLFCSAQLCWGPQSFETNSRHVKAKLDNEVPGLPTSQSAGLNVSDRMDGLTRSPR